ncbi:MAG: hypothetical protein NVS4B13_06160 [Candidatus Elarobacter sp.]
MIVRSAAVAALILAMSGVAIAGSAAHVPGGAIVALNPQPEPPGAMDARQLPPGPCRSLLVSVTVEGGATASAHAVPTRVSGRCAYDIPLPGARIGATARVTISRAEQ